MTRTFLLSPAYAGGRRAQMLLSERAQFALATRLRGGEPVSLGEVFTFLSGLYFRGKLAYANAFAPDFSHVLVITPTRGLVPAATTVTLADLREFAEVDIAADDPRYRRPLERDLRRLVRQMSPKCEVVLLGSIATGKYVSVMLEILQERLRFPADFVGRGDMSRGGLLLRCAVDRTELDYIPVHGAVRKGKRPPKLEPRRYT
ncbi:MAG TPA: hypothetical protein VGL24_03030, partial [Chthoniobacterales bacterium]